MPGSLSAALLNAQSKLGSPYVWGATGPYSFDCSGLVYWAYKTAGIPVARTTAANLGKQGKAIPENQAVPGDLVYIDEPGATDHVGLWVSPGRMIDAPHSGASVEYDSIPRNAVIRDITGGSGTDNLSNGISTAAGQVAAGAASAAAALNPFSGWQDDVLTIALKVAGAAACAALVIVGAKETVKGNS